jgi:hypothetical protein
VKSKEFISLSDLFPFKLLLFPVFGLFICSLSVYFSGALKREDSWASATYEELSAGKLLLLVLAVFFCSIFTLKFMGSFTQLIIILLDSQPREEHSLNNQDGFEY